MTSIAVAEGLSLDQGAMKSWNEVDSPKDFASPHYNDQARCLLKAPLDS